MHDLLEVSPQIIIQQLDIKPAPRIKVCELVTSNTLITPSLINNIYRFCSKIEVSLVCSSFEEFMSIKNSHLDVFGMPSIKLIFINSLDELKENYFDILFGNLSSLNNNLALIGNDISVKNPGSFLIKKLCEKSKTLSLYLDKSFLHSSDHFESRKLFQSFHILGILDFNKINFGSNKFEIIHLTFKTGHKPNERLRVIYTPTKEIFIQNQLEITNPFFPNWVLYLNESFYELLNKLELNIFNVDRDRQIKNAMLDTNQSTLSTPVIKSKHLDKNAINIEQEFNNDPYFIDQRVFEKLSVKKFLNNENVFLCPNMTPHIRIFRKPKGYLMNSSVCILTPKSQDTQISESDLTFWKSDTFMKFYKIARNNSQLNLNIDKSAVFYFGKLKNN